MVYGLFDPESTGDCTDEQLLSQFVTQSDEMAQAAFAILVERYSPIVHHVCWNVLGNAHNAQDAAQAVFLVLAAGPIDSKAPLAGSLVTRCCRARGEACENCRRPPPRCRAEEGRNGP